MAERLAGTIFFNHHHRGRFHHLIGGKALAALQAFPPAADSFPLIGRAGIDDLAFGKTAKRAFHSGLFLLFNDDIAKRVLISIADFTAGYKYFLYGAKILPFPMFHGLCSSTIPC